MHRWHTFVLKSETTTSHSGIPAYMEKVQSFQGCNQVVICTEDLCEDMIDAQDFARPERVLILVLFSAENHDVRLSVRAQQILPAPQIVSRIVETNKLVRVKSVRLNIDFGPCSSGEHYLIAIPRHPEFLLDDVVFESDFKELGPVES